MSAEVVDQLVDAVFLVEPDGSVLDASPAALQRYGYSLDEMLALNLRDLRVQPDGALAEDRYGEPVQHGVMFELLARRSDGTLFPAECRSVAVQLDGRPAVLSIVSDIAEREQVAEALRESEMRLRLLFDRDPDGIVILDPSTARLLEFNETAHKQLGYTREEFARLMVSDIEDMETPADTRERIDSVLRESRADFDTRQRTKSGEVRNVRVTAQLIEVAGHPVYHCIWRDVTDQVRERAQLDLSLSVIEAVLESVDSGVLVVSGDGEILRTNRKFAELWNVPEPILASGDDAELLGYVVDQLSDPEEFLSTVARLYDDPGGAFDELNFKDGRVFERSSRSMLAAGGLTGRVWSFRDITERKRVEEEIRRLNNELEDRVQERTRELTAINEELVEANRAKSDFLASMSHELRTPLNSIIGFSGIMLKGLSGPLSAEQELQISMVSSSGKRLLALVDDILDLSKVESGQSAAVVEEFEIQPIISATVEMLRPLADAKGIGLKLVCEPGIESLRSDPRVLVQIMTNLLGNAIKFTDSGEVSLSVVAEDGFVVVVAVTDTGRGITEAELPHIMERFYQAAPVAEAKNEGAGLGLAISSRARMGQGRRSLSVFQCNRKTLLN
jgi:PAS domain S-box-containing protein